jgi:ferric-dicitrate binding protein FerR (iron transport regulator)
VYDKWRPAQKAASRAAEAGFTPQADHVGAPALRNLEISGVFATDDTEAFIAFLRSLEGVQVEVTATRIRVSQK